MSVDVQVVALSADQQVRWPKGVPHRLWTEGAPMTTLMVERSDAK